MKTKLIALALLSLTLVAQAANLTPGVNPPPSVSLSWDASVPGTDPIDGYRLYYGTASGQYTNFVQLGGVVTNYTFVYPTRGTMYYFVATSTALGLESLPSNEVNRAAKTPPGSPGMKPPVTLTVQSKSASDPSAQWATLLDLALPSDASNQQYRTKLTLVVNDTAPQLVSPQVRALRALHAIPQPPAPK